MIAGSMAGIMDALAQSHGMMSDSETEMSCLEIAASVAQVDAILDDLGLRATDCVAFSCRNDIPSAIVLLALLAGGRNFMLSPTAEAAAGRGMDAQVPARFCRVQLQLAAGAQGATIPALALVENPRWRGNLPAGDGRFFVPTSGSTGGSKVVQHRHERLLRAARECADRLRLDPADRIALPVPINHMFGLGAAFLPAVLAGASIDLQSNANVLRTLGRERHFAPTVAFLTPSFAEALIRVRKSPRQYRLTVMAGDRLTADLFDHYERLHGCLVNLYGSTELGVIAAGDPGDPVTLRRDVIGRLMPGATIVPAPEPEGADVLWFRHETGFECYVDSGGQAVCATDGTIASGACFRSNDVGRLIDGCLVVLGRGDDLVNRDGLLIACGDIAAALLSIPGIADAVVLAGAMSLRGRSLIAFCVPAADAHWDKASLRRACLTRLPPRAVPDVFVFLRALPRLPSGKPDRMGLRRLHDLEQVNHDGDIRSFP